MTVANAVISTDEYDVQERQSGQVSFTLKDETGAAVASAAMSTMTLTLYNTRTGTILNSREAQNVLNANNVTMHATSGLVTWTMQPADNAIEQPGRDFEVHIGLFRMTWASGAKEFAHRVKLNVYNIGKMQ